MLFNDLNVVTILWQTQIITPEHTSSKKKKMVVPLKLGIMIIVIAQTLLIFMDESSGVNSYPCDSHDANIVDETNIMKVNLSVYYGSLCQPCSTFIIKNLQEIFYNGLINIINLQLVPWANAYINNDTNNSIICQVLCFNLFNFYYCTYRSIYVMLKELDTVLLYLTRSWNFLKIS